MKVKQIAVFIAAILLAGCSYDYFSHHYKKRYRNHKSEVTLEQIAQLRILDTIIFSRGAGVYIRPIMVNRKDVGVYGYNRNSTHFGRVHFFEYRNDSVILIPRSNEDSLKLEVQNFLHANNFSSRKIKVGMKRLKSVYDILSTDSF